MTDNLFEIIALQSKIIIAEMIDKTKRCAITWNQRDTAAFFTKFQWNNYWYDVYLTPVSGAYVLDLVKNKRNVLSLSSYIDSQVWVLYYVIMDVLNEQLVVKEIIQDLNLIKSARHYPKEIASGGIKVGSEAINSKIKVGSAGGGVRISGISINESMTPVGGVKVGGTADIRGGRIVVQVGGGMVAGGEVEIHLGELLYMTNSGRGNIYSGIDILYDNESIELIVNNLGNDAPVSKLQVDFDLEKLFYTKNGSIAGSGGIYYSKLDGTYRYNLILKNYVLDIVLDKMNQHIYYCHAASEIVNADYQISRCGYNGSNIILLTESTSIMSVDIDENSHLYWIKAGYPNSYLYRADYDEIGLSNITLIKGDLPNASRCVTVKNDKIYIGGSATFYKMDLDGSNEEYFPMVSLSIINDIVVDTAHIYISDIGKSEIFRCDLDGNNLESLTPLTAGCRCRSGIAFARK